MTRCLDLYPVLPIYTSLVYIMYGSFMKYSVAEPLVDPYEAVEVFLKELGSLGVGCEEISVEDSFGRVACKDILLPMPMPPFPRSLVDGYAVLYSDVAGASRDRPARVRVAGRIDIGVGADHILIEPGSCYEVATGSHLPRNTDLVIPIEYTEERGSEVIIYKSYERGAGIAYPGGDLPSGTVIVRRGWVIDERNLSALASAGIKRVPVYRKPRVCIISTGRELLEPGEPLKPGMVYESNQRALAAFLASMGFYVEPMGIVGDNRDEIGRAILSGVEKCDLVITIGGTSAGIEDYVYRVIGESGRIVLRGIKYRPGRPLTLGIIRGKPVIGLPGNPVAVLTIVRVVLPKLLKRIRGEDETPRAPIQGRARILRRLRGARGRTTNTPCILIRGPGGLFLLPWVMESYAISRLSLADVYIEIPYEKDRPVEVGEEVEYRAFGREPRAWVLEAGEIVGSMGFEGDRFMIYTSREEARRWLDMGAASMIHVCSGYRIEGDRVLVEITSLPGGVKYTRELRVLVRERVKRIPGYGGDTCFSQIVERILRDRGVESYVVIDVELPAQARDMFLHGLIDIALEPFVP